MSRLDDELRNAFRRAQPPVDFLARVLERAALQPEPRPSWWRRLAMLLGTPRLRWVAIGVTAALLLVISVTQYARLRRDVVDDRAEIALTPPRSDEGGTEAANSKGEDRRSDAVPATGSQEKPKPHSASTIHRKAPANEAQKVTTAEAEAAKEKLMLALYIASATLNDAEKAVHDDNTKP